MSAFPPTEPSSCNASTQVCRETNGAVLLPSGFSGSHAVLAKSAERLSTTLDRAPGSKQAGRATKTLPSTLAGGVAAVASTYTPSHLPIAVHIVFRKPLWGEEHTNN